MDFETILQFIVLALAIEEIYRRYVGTRKFVERHPPIDYVGEEGAGNWRWAEPPTALSHPSPKMSFVAAVSILRHHKRKDESTLRREDRATTSRMWLPNSLSAVNVVGSVIGFVMIASGAILLIWNIAPALREERLGGLLVICILILWGGYTLLDLDAKVVAMDLEQDRVTFFLRHGIALYKPIVWTRGDVAGFSGQVQSLLAVNRYQEAPYYVLKVRTRTATKSFLTLCDPAQGSWLVAGLENWRCALPQ